MDGSWSTLTTVALLVASFSPAASIPSPKSVPDFQIPDVHDHSWIKKWVAVGDSYAAGIGAGEIRSEAGAGSCSRYDLSYPSLMNEDERLGPSGERNFRHLACSGATSEEVLEKQVKDLEGGQQMITVSAGGNDVGFSGIVMDCIYQVRGLPTEACDKALDETENKIENVLFDNLSRLGKALAEKLDGGGIYYRGMIYWTGYARFWNEETDQCNDQSWATWFNIGEGNRVKLTKERRQRMNKMTDAVNRKIGEVVKTLGDRAVFVDYDRYFGELRGRFCEAGITEPDPSRPGVLFYNWNTNDHAGDDEDSGDLRRGASEETGKKQDPAVAAAADAAPANGTWEDELFDAMQRTQKEHPDWRYGPDRKQIPVDNGGLARRGLFDSWLRIFHPRPLGHSLIANLVLFKMGQTQARAWGFPLEEATSIDPCEEFKQDDGNTQPPDTKPPVKRVANGELTCSSFVDSPMKPGDIPHGHMALNEALFAIDDFCNGIPKDTFFRPGGTPIYSKTLNEKVLLAEWRPAEHCTAALDFSQDDAVETCKARLKIPINECKSQLCFPVIPLLLRIK